MKRGSCTRASSSSVGGPRPPRGRSVRRRLPGARAGGDEAFGPLGVVAEGRVGVEPRVVHEERALSFAVHVRTTHVAALRARMIAFSRGVDAGRLGKHENANQDHRGQRPHRGRGRACCRSCSCARALSSATGNKDQLTMEAQNDVNGAAGRLQLDGLRAERWLAAAANEPATPDALHEGVAGGARRRGDQALRRPRQQDEERAALREERPDARRARRREREDRRPQRHEHEPRRRHGGHLPRASSRRSRRGSRGRTSGTRRTATSRRTSPCTTRAGRSSARSSRPAAQRHALARQRGDDRAGARPRRAQGRRVRRRRPLGASARSRSTTRSTGAARRTCSRTPSPTSRPTTCATATCSSRPRRSPSFEDGKRALLVAAAPASLIADPSGLALLPIFGAVAVGIVLVIVGGWLLGNYITRPINMLEEGLLAILNGQADKRFELDHAELGGLAFRIDQLLNQLMGVEEDTTDAEGRVSKSPSAANFTDALAVDDKRMTQSAGEMTMDPDAIRRLAAEPPAQYYARIYREYIDGQEGHRRADRPHHRAGVRGAHPGHGAGGGPEVRAAGALPGPGAEQRGRPPRCSLAVARQPRYLGGAADGSLRSLQGRRRRSTKRQPGRQVGRPHREAGPELRPAGGHPGPGRDGDAGRGRGAAQALHLPHGSVDHRPGGEGVGVPRHPARRQGRHRARARVRRQGREPRVADEDHEGARRRRRVRRGAAALALAVGHRVRQVRRPEGADPRRARGAQARRHPRRRSSASSRT